MPDIFKWHHNQCCKFYSYKLSNSLRVLVVLLEKDVISSCPLLNTFNSSVISIFKFHHISVQFSSVQSLSHVRLFVTPWITACQASLSSQTPGVYSKSCSSSWWCHPAISSCHPFLLLPPIPPSIRVFSNESILHMRWPKYWSFSFSIIIYSTFNIQILRSELIVLIFRSLY